MERLRHALREIEEEAAGADEDRRRDEEEQERHQSCVDSWKWPHPPSVLTTQEIRDRVSRAQASSIVERARAGALMNRIVVMRDDVERDDKDRAQRAAGAFEARWAAHVQGLADAVHEIRSLSPSVTTWETFGHDVERAKEDTMTALDRAHREEHDAKIAHIGQIWECLERTSAEAEGVRELRRAWVREMRLDVEDGAVIQGIRATLRARSFDEFRQAARKLQLLVHPDKHREGTQQSLAKAWPDGDPLSDFVKCAINRPTPWTDYVSRVCHLLVKISEMCPATTATTTTVLLPSVHSILEELR